MLVAIRHEWPSASKFVFNFYRHAMTCIIRGTDGTFRTVYCREGTAQGCPIAMYAFGILTLRQLRPPGVLEYQPMVLDRRLDIYPPALYTSPKTISLYLTLYSLYMYLIF